MRSGCTLGDHQPLRDLTVREALRDQHCDLELARHGLELIDSDPLFMMPFANGEHIFIHRSVEETLESIARVSPQEAYWRLADEVETGEGHRKRH